jgi:uncharacterized membrane protein (DUF4010 family)
MLAAVANTIFKIILTFSMASSEVKKRTLLSLGCTAIFGMSAVLFLA